MGEACRVSPSGAVATSGISSSSGPSPDRLTIHVGAPIESVCDLRHANMSDGKVRHRTAAKSDDDHLAQSSHVAVPSVRRRSYKFRTIFWVRIIAIIGVLTVFLLLTNNNNVAMKTESNDQLLNERQNLINAPMNKVHNQVINRDPKCSFRSYPSKRFYGLSSSTSSQPDFLSEAAYIRGQWPIILNPYKHDDTTTIPVSKVCIDTTSWEDLSNNSGGKKVGARRLPFTDGHNPSVVSLSSNPYISDDDLNDKHIRLDPKNLGPISTAMPTIPLDDLFLSVSTFGSGQCNFGFTPQEMDQYNVSLLVEPTGGKRAVIAILASSFQTLAQTTLLLERDAKYGSRKNTIKVEKSPVAGLFARMHQEFDDARLFFHLGRVWVLYRNGPLFGYESQLHNPIHFEEMISEDNDADAKKTGNKFVAYVKASETVVVGGGRNIALISEEPIGHDDNGVVRWVPNPTLKALTWVDPVTVVDDIDLHGLDELFKKRRLQEDVKPLTESRHDTRHRRLGSKPTKSHIHGTNGYLVPLTSTSELLGIAHFHRPENRGTSEYAMHGHHYTHTFFAIAREDTQETDTENINNVTSRPFKLRRLSNEFVFRTNSIPFGETQPPPDTDIIQFASGIDLVGSDVDGNLVISYGINDCEGAVFTVLMSTVQSMLLSVDSGQEVVDLMERVKR